MKKSVFLAALALIGAGAAVQAQDVTLSTSTVGSEFDLAMYYKGNARDSGDFNADNGNVWNCCWFFSDGTTAAFADQNFTGTPHNNQLVVNDTPVPSATSFTTNGLTFGSVTAIADLTANLTVTVDEPVAGTSARATWAWTFNNASASPKNLRVVWFVDADIYIGAANYNTNFVGFLDSANNAKGAIAMGDTNGAGGIALARGMVMDTNVAPTALVGFSNGSGPSYYWSNNAPYNPDGIEATNGVVAALQDSIEANNAADANGDDISDAATDVGGAMQFDIVIPASGSASAEMYLTVGGSTDVAPNSWAGITAVPSWDLY